MANPSWNEGPPQTIVLATDLSSRCDRALDRAAHLADAWGARLIILNVLEPDEDGPLRRQMVDLPSWRRPPNREVVAAARIRRDLNRDLKSVEVRLVEGEPASAIDEVAREVDAGLIVIGVARDETLGRYFLGSTVDRLARMTAIPLLVVKSRLRPYGEVLVATDFSPSAQHALTAASRFFSATPITLLHTWEVPFPGFLDDEGLRNEWRALEQKTCDEFVAGSDLSPEQRRGGAVFWRRSTNWR